jgi:hypothetical protein
MFYPALFMTFRGETAKTSVRKNSRPISDELTEFPSCHNEVVFHTGFAGIFTDFHKQNGRMRDHKVVASC